jgi:hypothetical protein
MALTLGTESGNRDEAGSLLADLERRQDDVLAQLDLLDRQVADLLRGLGVTLTEGEDENQPSSAFAELTAEADATPGNSVAQTDHGSGTGFAKLPSNGQPATGMPTRKSALSESTFQPKATRAA